LLSGIIHDNLRQKLSLIRHQARILSWISVAACLLKQIGKTRNKHKTYMANPTAPHLHIGFVLTPQFTLTAFAGFIDALRLAADEGDRSRPLLCRWAVLGEMGVPIMSSCGACVLPTAPLDAPEGYDYLVVVGGLLHGGQAIARHLIDFLQAAAAAHRPLVGLCTGSFVLARAGLLDGYLSCVSWFHRDDFIRAFPTCRVISDQMFVVDRDRLTCAGGTSVVHLAAYLIERHIGRARAVKALRIMIEQQPLPPRTLQPAHAFSTHSTDTLVQKAMLLLEQNLHLPIPITTLCQRLGMGRRQLERRFQRDIGVSPAQYRQRLRLERARWLLCHSDLDMIEISLQCGFQDSASFSRALRQFSGHSPRELRAKAKIAGRINPINVDILPK